MKLTREDSGSNFVANDGNGTTDVNESRVLATDLMHVSTELGKLVTTRELPRVYTILILIKKLLNLTGI
jgi:hypothetical protein